MSVLLRSCIVSHLDEQKLKSLSAVISVAQKYVKQDLFFNPNLHILQHYQKQLVFSFLVAEGICINGHITCNGM